MAPAIPSYARTCRKTVVCAVAGLANLTAQIRIRVFRPARSLFAVVTVGKCPIDGGTANPQRDSDGARVKAMQDKPLQASTIHTRFVNVRGVVRAAVKDRLLAHDVTATTRLPRQRKAAAAISIPTPAEVGSLLRDADSRFQAFVGLCAFGGLRLGEAAALQVGDVDFLKREIRVTRQVQRANGKQVEIRPPKYGSEAHHLRSRRADRNDQRACAAIPAWRRHGPLALPRRG
jgi:integrase